jgi:hypothetical protein
VPKRKKNAMATTMKNYILRIYRLDRKKPEHIVGLVEEVGVKEKKSFTNLQELWDILRHPGKKKKGRIGESEKRGIGEKRMP